MLKSIILRFVMPLALASAVVAYFAMPHIDGMLAEWFRGDIELRASLIEGSMEERIVDLVARRDRADLRKYLSHVATDRRLAAILICDADGELFYRTAPTPPEISCALKAAPNPGTSEILELASGPVHVSGFLVAHPDKPALSVYVVHDLGFAATRQTRARRYLIAFTAVSVVVIGLLVVLIAWFMLKRWAAVLIGDIRSRRFLDDAHSSSLSIPVLSQVRQVLREIEESQRLEIDYRENWTAQALHQVVRDQLRSPQMIVVSNREPYIHNRDASGRPHVQLPASGMVTALEPIVRACAGTWIAHGSGSADRQVVDIHDRIRVPPGDPAYVLRRVWLSEEEEEGYYYGFSNEGLWPLCHLAYVRPAFREKDWATYREVNQKFAAVVAREAREDNPVVLIQDYHFALLPRLIRERKPSATIVLFWHIPWPNAETFGVCPWKHEMLLHLLSADILGFHTRYHCQNFLATVDRFVECQIDHEHMTVTLQGHVCQVVPYPISIEWPPRQLDRLPPVEVAKATVRQRYGIREGVVLGLGVERWDFTKGIVERFQAVENLLERRPALRGKLTLLQIAAPSRSRLPAYRALQEQTMAELERINARFRTDGWQPIVLEDTQQPPDTVWELYRAADFCIVNSLHDGMNLVAKEFAAAREDEDGVLILSTFAGASRELLEALLVNPFDVSETATAIETAIEMPRDQRRERMQLMRRTVKENNVYRWAGRMLMDAARMRQRQALARRDSTGLQRFTGDVRN
ncbi:MAG: trehalose-6-phosphate synthase [Sinobacteraceae bacterium]|nr:trehalose-6-phosphate synthase [Nevskiaceae bacterium]